MLVTDNLQQLISGFIATIPKLTGALIILIVGIIISKLIRRILSGSLKKLNIDKYAEVINNFEFIEKTSFRVYPSVIISTILYYFILLIFIVAATDVLGMDSLSQLVRDILNWIPNLVTALLLLFVGFIFAEFAKNAVVKACDSFGVPSGKFIGSAVFYFILVNVLISALGQAKVNTNFIATNISILIAGIALAFAIGYGFASKDMVANFLVSFYSKDKLSLGQEVVLDGVKGTIVEIDKTSITLDTGERIVIIPLNKLSKDRIEIFKK
jgi:hypothetical protein